ncbi:C-term transposase for IS2404 [Mycobacterium ulcerans subsp. shinshuense]|uniref:C-term transposase for IS2404 n=1 Tax=Mycobacterium ulcerans subsp. shinshuense TaxID=1124626 RepID=A0A1B4Y0T3_MYCUL|nr:C-term transposase for IS2404 [Mycobacterium ulcerans subsp. shinshuense]
MTWATDCVAGCRVPRPRSVGRNPPGRTGTGICVRCWRDDTKSRPGRQRAHTGNGAQVLATLRNTAINLHRLNGADNIAEACRITALTANRRLDLLNPQFPSSQAC